MDPLTLLLGGVGGGIITGGVNLYIYRRTKAKPSNRAYEVLTGLKRALIETQGEHYVAKSSADNFRIANHLYCQVDGPVIATCFHESPASYGDADLARAYGYGGSFFTRVTTADICPDATAAQARDHLTRILPGSRLVVIPAQAQFVRVDGIFCRCSDDSYLCFFSLRDAADPRKNRGLAFRDGIASHFFNYFEDLASRYAP